MAAAGPLDVYADGFGAASYSRLPRCRHGAAAGFTRHYGGFVRALRREVPLTVGQPVSRPARLHGVAWRQHRSGATREHRARAHAGSMPPLSDSADSWRADVDVAPGLW